MSFHQGGSHRLTPYPSLGSGVPECLQKSDSQVCPQNTESRSLVAAQDLPSNKDLCRSRCRQPSNCTLKASCLCLRVRAPWPEVCPDEPQPPHSCLPFAGEETGSERQNHVPKTQLGLGFVCQTCRTPKQVFSCFSLSVFK